MAKAESDAPQKHMDSTQQTGASPRKPLLRSSGLKYYIHDRMEEFRLQLMGSAAEVDIAELAGCWQTARTTVGSRKVVLDLRALKAVDASAKEWIISMVSEGAVLIPESFLRSSATGQTAEGSPAGKLGLVNRIVSLVRGSRALPTRAQ